MKTTLSLFAVILLMASTASAQESTIVPDESELVSMDDTRVKYGTTYGQQFFKKGENTPYTGFLCSRYDNGHLETVQQFVDGIANGIWINFDPYGRKESKGTYLNNKTEGPVTIFYEDGSIKATGQYIHYKNPIGWWTYYNKQGSVVSKRRFTR
ncbi:MAG: hypothetical protein AAFP76_06850 [Bacteroidota bacterium]